MKQTPKHTAAFLTAAFFAMSSSASAMLWTAGHGDLGIEYLGSNELEPHWHLGEGNAFVTIDGVPQQLGPDGDEFEADELIAVTDLTTIRDADPVWDFIGVNSGESFYVFPEPEDPSVPYIGIGTEELAPVDWTGSLTLALTAFSGPGVFSLYSVNGFGAPTKLIGTDDGVTDADSLSLTPDDHVHYTWAFSAQGSYDLTFQIGGLHSVDGASTGSETFTVNVVPEPSSAGFIVLVASLFHVASARRRKA